MNEENNEGKMQVSNAILEGIAKGIIKATWDEEKQVTLFSLTDDYKSRRIENE